MTQQPTESGAQGRDVGAALRRRATIMFSILAVVLGAASIVVTIANDNGPRLARLLIGLMLVALGLMRLWLTLKSPLGKVGGGTTRSRR